MTVFVPQYISDLDFGSRDDFYILGCFSSMELAQQAIQNDIEFHLENDWDQDEFTHDCYKILEFKMNEMNFQQSTKLNELISKTNI